MRIEWAEPAEWEMDDTHAFIARDVPVYAEQFLDRLLESVSLLEEQPLMGRHVPEAKYRDDVRELIFQSYRVMYLFKPDYLYVIAVIHGIRDVENIERKPWEID